MCSSACSSCSVLVSVSLFRSFPFRVYSLFAFFLPQRPGVNLLENPVDRFVAIACVSGLRCISFECHPVGWPTHDGSTRFGFDRLNDNRKRFRRSVWNGRDQFKIQTPWKPKAPTQTRSNDATNLHLVPKSLAIILKSTKHLKNSVKWHSVCVCAPSIVCLIFEQITFTRLRFHSQIVHNANKNHLSWMSKATWLPMHTHTRFDEKQLAATPIKLKKKI